MRDDFVIIGNDRVDNVLGVITDEHGSVSCDPMFAFDNPDTYQYVRTTFEWGTKTYYFEFLG